MAVRASAECVGESLTRHYRLSCELFDTYPLPCFTHQLSQNRLCLTLHTIDRDHLEALCHTLKNKVSPSALTLTSGKAVDAGLAERAVEGVGVCLVASLSLASLSLEGVRLRGRTLRLLCEGVRKARTLKTLLIRNCTLGDSGTESVCQAVKNVPSITHLLLVNCGVTERGGTAVACLIKHQRLNRDSAMWQDTLRQRRPLLDAMRGLRRLSLNGNPALGDAGVTDIAQALTEDLWIKAVDLQHCGVGVDGGVACRALLHINHTLEVVDLRDNPFLPEVTAGEVTSLLQGRDSQGSSQYGWLKTSEEVGEEAAEDHQKEGYRGSGRVVRGRRGQPYPHIPTRRPKLPSQLGVPWRVEHRLYERREGLAPGSMVRQGGGEGQGGGEASEPAKDSGPEGEANLKKMRKKLEHYKKKYRREREHRQKVERKLSRIHSQLQGLHTLDDSTLNHIEECFLKFHILLSMMQNSGEQVQSSSSGTVSPLNHPSAELGGNQAHPETVHPPSTVPVPPVPPIIHQSLNASTSLHHVISASSPHDSRQGGDMETVKADNSTQRGDMETVKADNRKQRGDMETVKADNSKQRGDMETVKADNSRQRGDMETVKADNSRQRRDMETETAEDEPERPIVNKDDVMTKKIHSTERIVLLNQGSFLGSENTLLNGSRLNLDISALNQDRKPSTRSWKQLESNNRDEKMMGVFSTGEHDQETGMYTKRNRLKEVTIYNKGNDSSSHSSVNIVKEKQRERIIMQDDTNTPGSSRREVEKTTAECKQITPQDADSYAMRLEFNDKSGFVNDEWSDEKIKYINEINRKESRRSDTQHGKDISTQDFLFTSDVVDVPRKKQLFVDDKVDDKPVEEACPSDLRSQSSVTSQSPVISHSPLASQLYRAAPSPSSQFMIESQVRRPSPSPPGQILPVDRSPSTQSSSSSSTESPPSQSPQESHSLDRIQSLNQSPQKNIPPQNWSLKNLHLIQGSPSPQRNKSQQKQSPSKNKSPQEQSPKNRSQQKQSPSKNRSPEQSPKNRSQQKQSPSKNRSPEQSPKNRSQQKQSPSKNRSQQKQSPSKNKSEPTIQISEVSETDDEKIRNLKDWLQGQGRGTKGRNSTPSSSSMSISEHLQHSHTSWTKTQAQGKQEAAKEWEEEELDGSEIDLSDEDLSLSGITLSNTSVPEDIDTTREEDF